MFEHFSLTLMVNHACNLRCDYCYTGSKFQRAMPESVGNRAILKALASIRTGGTLALGFFGGEPLLESKKIMSWIRIARGEANRRGLFVEAHLTSNATLHEGAAWELLTDPALDVALSLDGPPVLHDRHRRAMGGAQSSEVVAITLEQLREAGKAFRSVTVVRPDNVLFLEEILIWLRLQGVSAADLSLDLWAKWSCDDMPRLAAGLEGAARFWWDSVPDFPVSWFDGATAGLTGIPKDSCARCAYGDGEVAVAPSGRLYPCERLIGEDREDNRSQLSEDLFGRDDFIRHQAPAGRDHPACNSCRGAEACNTTCRCSNFIRTGEERTPDRLLCALNQYCWEAVSKCFSSVPTS